MPPSAFASPASAPAAGPDGHTRRLVAVDFAAHLPGLQELLRVVVGEGIFLQTQVAHGTPAVQVDLRELELALINLAFNAREAMPRGGRLRINVQNAESSAGEYVALAFDHDPSGPVTEALNLSSGLSLRQVRDFAAQAGGHVRVATVPGGSGCVTLLLPPAAAPAGAAAAPAPLQEPPPDAALTGRRVLLVDDNEALAAVTAALLEACGCQVVTAASPGHALGLLECGERFDVVLSDVVMPGEMDGMALAHHLRGRFALPVVLISGYSSVADGDQGMRVLRKPCSPQQLVATLAAAIRAR